MGSLPNLPKIDLFSLQRTILIGVEVIASIFVPEEGPVPRAALAILLFASPLMVAQQDQAAAAFAAAGCGKDEVQFAVKTDKKQHPQPQPEPGKAMVYVIQNDGVAFCIGGCVTVRIGVDGAWAGANQGKSYLYFPVDPGDHHLCAAYQGRSQWNGAVSFNAEAGRSYYFFIRAFNGVWLGPVDPAEGPLLVQAAPLSTSKPKEATAKQPDSARNDW
jgi:hypothetical protein